MSTTSRAPTKTDILKEDALANIERLFRYWGLQFFRVNDDEIDFINPMRQDENFGAVRFNITKGIGADFSNTAFTEADFNNIGAGFDRSDFGFSDNKNISYGFDIIGLCQRLYNLPTYKEGERILRKHLGEIDKVAPIKKADLDASIKRKMGNAEQIIKRVDYAKTILKHCKSYPDTLADVYFKSRGIHLTDEELNIRFHPRVMCADLNKPLPAVVFMIKNSPEGEVRGIHRIYLANDGMGKAPINDPKRALGDVKGNGIWFGNPSPELHIAEGPENALTLRVCGAAFVVCGISAVNMSSLSIPPYVKKVIVCPDPDEAGKKAALKCKLNYIKYNPEIVFPTKVVLPNGKYADLNDLLMKHKDDTLV